MDPLVIDARGKTCPTPVIDLARAIGDVDVGGELVLLADDPGAKVDIPVWCRMKQHDYLGVEETGEGLRFRIRRAG